MRPDVKRRSALGYVVSATTSIHLFAEFVTLKTNTPCSGESSAVPLTLKQDPVDGLTSNCSGKVAMAITPIGLGDFGYKLGAFGVSYSTNGDIGYATSTR